MSAKKKFSRRDFLRMSALTATGVALAGCAPEVIKETVEVEKEVTKEVEVPVEQTVIVEKEVEVPAEGEQVLRIITGSSGSASFAFNCLVAGSDLQNWMPFLYMPPAYFDVDLNMQPGVFQSWESNDDSTVWTFHLDPAAQFSNGDPITASDVKGTWEIQTAPEYGVGRITGYIGNVVGFDEAREAGGETPISGLKAVDEQTLEVTLKTPDPVFHFRVATCHLNPIHVEHYKANGGWEEYWYPEKEPPYSGPYVLTAYDPDLKTAEMRPNSNWWGDEGPYLDKITFVFVTDQQTMAAMLLNDQADVTLAPLGPEMRERMPDMFRPIKSFGYGTFWINPFTPPTDDINVRKALAHAIDWEAVFAATFPAGGGIKTYSIIDPELPCNLSKDDVPGEYSYYAYDVEAAKDFLAQSSYGSAEALPKLRVTPRGSNVYNNRALEAMMGMWRENLGLTNVEFKQQPDEFGEDVEKLNLNRDDAVIRFPDTATYMWTACSSEGPVTDPNGSLLPGYQNPDVDEPIFEAMTLSADDPQRCELPKQAAVAFMEDHVQFPFGKFQMVLNAREYVKNYMKGPDVGVIEPWKISLEK
jgi:ABC-type transport system substrate-binding protein